VPFPSDFHWLPGSHRAARNGEGDFMLRHILRRLLLAIPTLFVVITIIFVLVRVIPGDPAVAALGDQASEQAIEQLREQLGLDKPIWQQYIDYMAGLLRGDFGNSMISRAPAWNQIAGVLPHSLELAVAAIIIALALGCANRHPDRHQAQHLDRLHGAGALAGGPIGPRVLHRYSAHLHLCGPPRLVPGHRRGGTSPILERTFGRWSSRPSPWAWWKPPSSPA
jgi:hypothetical protein